MSSVRLLAPCGTDNVLVALAHTLDANTLPSPASLKSSDPLNQVRGKVEPQLRTVRLGVVMKEKKRCSVGSKGKAGKYHYPLKQVSGKQVLIEM